MCSYLCPCDLEKISEDARNDWLHVKYTKALRLKYDRCIQGPVDLGDVDLQEALLKLKDRANSRDEIAKKLTATSDYKPPPVMEDAFCECPMLWVRILD